MTKEELNRILDETMKVRTVKDEEEDFENGLEVIDGIPIITAEIAENPFRVQRIREKYGACVITAEAEKILIDF